MKKLLKILFWFLVAALTAHTLTSCKKDEAKPLNWYLDFSIFNERFGNMPANAIGTNIGNDGRVVGQSMDFENESLRCRIYTENDHVTQLTGLYEGKPFVLVDDSVNICNGGQRVPVKFKIEYR